MNERFSTIGEIKVVNRPLSERTTIVALGRVTFQDSNNDGFISTSEVVQRNHYYPFGMDMEGPWNGSSSPATKYKYNNKETMITDLVCTTTELGIMTLRWGGGTL
jgi:hypothetical protein